MSFKPRWTTEAQGTFEGLKTAAEKACVSRAKSGKTKASKQEGLYKQVAKALRLLLENPRHTGLQTHPYESLPNPVDPSQKVFEAYVQNRTPGAYRIFWCYGPESDEITIIAITPHP